VNGGSERVDEEASRGLASVTTLAPLESACWEVQSFARSVLYAPADATPAKLVCVAREPIPSVLASAAAVDAR
jgi:hypothetical protein